MKLPKNTLFNISKHIIIVVVISAYSGTRQTRFSRTARVTVCTFRPTGTRGSTLPGGSLRSKEKLTRSFAKREMKKYVSLCEHGIVPLSLWDWIFQEIKEMMVNEMVIKGHVGHHRSTVTTEGVLPQYCHRVAKRRGSQG